MEKSLSGGTLAKLAKLAKQEAPAICGPKHQATMDVLALIRDACRGLAITPEGLRDDLAAHFL
jgi:hypothetical protein